MATLDDVATFLQSASVGTVGATIFKGQAPAAPDAVVTLYEYGGAPPEHVGGQTAIAVEYPRIQVTVRGEPNDYAAPRALAETAYRALAAASNRLLGTTFYGALSPLQAPFLLRKDENDRVIVAFNIEIMKELTA